MSRRVSLLAVGDVGARRSDPASIFRHCRDLLASGDLTLGQLETTVSDRGAKAPNARLAMRTSPTMAGAARAAGFDIMSFAGNHCLDWGFDAFDDTLAHMAAAGVALCGAGPELEAALRPAIAPAGDLKVAIVAASSILPEGYAAEAGRPGCAPLRAHTVYQQIEPDQPGTPARVLSFADRRDLRRLAEAVEAAQAAADLVLVSLHWGVHMVKGVLADYQREAAEVLIEAGAAAVLGHHPHILKGVGFHRGAPVFFSLGNFAIEQPHVWDPAITRTASFRHLVSLNPGWSMDRLYMLPEETRMTGVARLIVEAGAVVETRFRPAWIEDDSAPRLLGAGEALFDRVKAYLEEISAGAGLTTRFIADGDELVLSPA